MKTYKVFVGENGYFDGYCCSNTINECIKKVIMHCLEGSDLVICSEDEEEMIAAYNNFDGTWQIDYFKPNCFNIDHRETINIVDLS